VQGFWNSIKLFEILYCSLLLSYKRYFFNWYVVFDEIILRCSKLSVYYLVRWSHVWDTPKCSGSEKTIKGVHHLTLMEQRQFGFLILWWGITNFLFFKKKTFLTSSQLNCFLTDIHLFINEWYTLYRRFL